MFGGGGGGGGGETAAPMAPMPLFMLGDIFLYHAHAL